MGQRKKEDRLNVLIVYDSVFGNTEKIARSIGAGIGGGVKVAKVDAVSSGDLLEVDLLVIGSPTVAGRATRPLQAFVDGLPRAVAEKARCAAFDTRVAMKFARLFGYAAPRISEVLRKRGSAAASEPQGFIVKGRNGPLADGELERATAWGRRLGAPVAGG